MRVASLLASLLLCTLPAAAFYLPSVAPISHRWGEPIRVIVNSLRSIDGVVPFRYYDLPFCLPANHSVKDPTLGETLWGDHMETSPYYVNMMQNVTCMPLTCLPGNNAQVKAGIPKLKEYIELGYRGRMSIDNLPGFRNATAGSGLLNDRPCPRQPIPVDFAYLRRRGYMVGVPSFCDGRNTLLNNHLHFDLKAHDAGDGNYRVVGFAITPYSVQRVPASGSDATNCDATFRMTGTYPPQTVADLARLGDNDLLWTYSVQWTLDPVTTWSTRWDEYFNTSPADSSPKVHWYYILNVLAIAAVLCLLATMILMRTLHKDFNTYNANDDPDARQEEVGWKLVHADVFRPPRYANILAVIVGSGCQFWFACVVALVFALFGFLTPAARDTLTSTMILLFVLMSLVGGYVCGMLLKMWAMKEWKIVFLCGAAVPGIVFVVFLIVNSANAAVHAADVAGMLTVLTLFALWVVFAIPLTVLGASFAFHQAAIEPPVRIGKIAREIPPQRWQYSPPFVTTVPALIPFIVGFLELSFIFDSIWQGMVYTVFFFLFLTFIVWMACVALVTVIATYYQLTYEDYRWWWRVLLVPSGCGIYPLLYVAYYWLYRVNIRSFTGSLAYWCYMLLFALLYCLVSGAIGFTASFFFVRKIYSSIRVD